MDSSIRRPIGDGHFGFGHRYHHLIAHHRQTDGAVLAGQTEVETAPVDHDPRASIKNELSSCDTVQEASGPKGRHLFVIG